MIFKIIGAFIVGVFLFAQYQYIRQVFFKKEVNLRPWFIVSLLTTTLGTYLMFLFIVNLDTGMDLSFSYIFEELLSIILYIYGIIMLASIALEVVKDIKLEKRSDLYFDGFTITKILGFFLLMSFLVLLTV